MFINWLGILALGLVLVSSIKGNRTAILNYYEKKYQYESGVPEYMKLIKQQNDDIKKALDMLNNDTVPVKPAIDLTRPNGSNDSAKTNVIHKIDTTVLIPQDYTISDDDVVELFNKYQRMAADGSLVELRCIKDQAHGAYVIGHSTLRNGPVMLCRECNHVATVPVSTIKRFVK
jgi:hypothetical protein